MPIVEAFEHTHILPKIEPVVVSIPPVVVSIPPVVVTHNHNVSFESLKPFFPLDFSLRTALLAIAFFLVVPPTIKILWPKKDPAKKD